MPVLPAGTGAADRTGAVDTTSLYSAIRAVRLAPTVVAVVAAAVAAQ